ncbi:MAG: TatD family hydrolase [Candidatus Marsarchaeota archaeon]|jgi:TatD DNase family protein|nr:TatD family hydrolase [Candidatus Marsarchaeota archaeon]
MAFAQISTKKDEMKYKQRLELLDAHCHADMLSDEELDTAMARGVTALVVNGVDTASNMSVLGLNNRTGIFPALGIHPENAAKINKEEIEYNINLIKANSKSVKAIGEIGLDYAFAKDENEKNKQKELFKRFVELAIELDKPVSVHSREAIDDVLDILENTGIKKAHIHFFEGNAKQAKRVESLGFMVSIPPMHSAKRMDAITALPIANIMAETDSPTAGMHIYDIDKSVMLIAKAKGMDFESCAVAIADNTKRFFNISVHNLIRRI